MSSKEKKLAAAAEEAKKTRKFYTKCVIFIVCFALIVAAAAIINSDITATMTTALKVGSTRYSPAEFSYFYRSLLNQTYSELYNSYGDLTAYFIDTSTPLTEQVSMYGDGEQTWADYFNSQAIVSLTNLTVLYDAAMKAGYSLSDEDKTNIDTEIAAWEAQALEEGASNLDQYLQAVFGKGVDEKLVRELAEKQTVASAYSNDVNSSFSFTAEEIENHYSEQADSFDFISYHSHFVGTSNTVFEEVAEEEKAAAAHEAAEQIADAASGAQFTLNVQNFVAESSKSAYEDESATLTISQGVNLPSTYSEWLLDPARVAGDTTVIDTDTGSYAVLFASRNDNHYALVDARHILISAEADENGSYTDEALDAAKTEAERIHALWQEDPTAENFAALAEEYSEDGGSNTNGGLYQEIYQNYMVDEFNDFLFNSGSQPGDSAVVYGNNGSYAGYHVVYFEGTGDLFSDRLSESDLRSAAYDEAISALAENYSLTTGFGMRFVNMA